MSRQHRHPAAVAAGQVGQRRAHGERVGVVAVLDQGRRRRSAARSWPRIAESGHLDRARPAGGSAPERPAAGERGRRVAQLPGLAQAEVEVDVGRGRRSATTVTPGSRVARCGSSSGSSSGTTRGAAGAQGLEDLGLRRRHRLDGPEQLQVHRADRRDRRPRRAGPARRARRSGRCRACPSRPRATSRALGQAHQRHRHADLGVAVARGALGGRRRPRRSIATRMSFVVVLPVAPVMPTTLAAAALEGQPPGRLQHRHRVGRHDHRPAHALARRPRSSARPTRPPPPRPRRRAGRRARAGRRRRARRAAPTKSAPGHDLARVHARALDLGVRGPDGQARVDARPQDLVDGQPHALALPLAAPPAPRGRRRGRRTASSPRCAPGPARAPCPRSPPRRPARASPTAQRDRRPPVGLDDQRAPPPPSARQDLAR